RHTRFSRDWSSDVCSSDLVKIIEKNDPVGTLTHRTHCFAKGLSGKASSTTRDWEGGIEEHIYVGTGHHKDDPIGKQIRVRRRAKIGRASCREREWRVVGDA